MTRLSYILKLLRRSFWVIPGIMTAAAAALAIGVIWLDAGLLSQLELSWAKPLMVNAESGGRILSAIAGSMITVASLVFSMTLIALTMAASNIGPRLIERFMRDRVTQISLGLFVATFVYCLLVLRTVRGGEAAPFAPHLAINLAVLFAILSFGWLVYFIHKIAVSIQTDEVVANTGADFVRAIERYSKGDSGISESCSRGDVGPILPAGHDTDGVDVEAGAAGYIQVIDTAALFKLAERRDLTIVMLRRPGHFVLAGTPLARIHSPGRQVDDDAVDHVLKHVVMGSTRTAVQDVELLINMVVEVAARALSPGVNDFYSAIACVDHLCHGLGVVLQKGLPANLFFDGEGRLRVALCLVTFADLADAAFNPIRQCAWQSVPVSIRMLEALTNLAAVAESEADRDALAKHATLVTQAALDGAKQEADRQDIRHRNAAFNRQISASDRQRPRRLHH